MATLSDLTNDLGQRIRDARADRPQTAAADELGVSIRTFQDWEAGRSFPQMRFRGRLADWLAASENEAAR